MKITIFTAKRTDSPLPQSTPATLLITYLLSRGQGFLDYYTKYREKS